MSYSKCSVLIFQQKKNLSNSITLSSKTVCLHFWCTPRYRSDESIPSLMDQPFYNQPSIVQIHRIPTEGRSSNTPPLLGIWVYFRWFDPIQTSECDCHRETVVRRTILPKFYIEHTVPGSSGQLCWIWICLFWKICPYTFRRKPTVWVLDFRPILLSFQMRNKLCCCSPENNKCHPVGLSTVSHWSLCWKSIKITTLLLATQNKHNDSTNLLFC